MTKTDQIFIALENEEHNELYRIIFRNGVNWYQSKLEGKLI